VRSRAITQVANGIAWLDDIQAFYRERAVIEKEYAAKISALSKRFYDKKSKKSASLTVGDTPSLTPGSLERCVGSGTHSRRMRVGWGGVTSADTGPRECSASLTTWATILTTTEALAAEHDTFSTALNTQVADVLKFIATRYEDYRKRYESLSQKLASERDSVYSDLKKAKNGYDVECKGVEEKRQKVDKSYDSSKAKAQRSYETELVEMSNVKVRAPGFEGMREMRVLICGCRIRISSRSRSQTDTSSGTTMKTCPRLPTYDTHPPNC